MKNQSEISDDLSPVKRALLAVEELSARLAVAQRARTEPIAICGIGCRFPGGANDPESFWQLLRDGQDAVAEVPETRWDANTNGGSIRWGAFVENVDQFDAAFFGISPREATHMDPQQRLVLEVAWEALEDAGQAVERLAGTSTGVFLGIYNNDYAWLQSNAPEDIDVYAATGGGQGIAANRLSYLLDLRGPSLAVDTTCSSSLVAVHLACQSLRNGECRVALAGGVNLLLSPEIALSVSKVVPLAADGRCKTFDARADGIVRGEGCGIVVLKRLTDAVADGDNIIAVIKGSATNHDGHSNGFTAPNGVAQQAVIRQALQNSGLTPAQISYVEAHGTGTQLGDPIEWESLEAVFRGHTSCLVGSVKTNVGHLEAAAGIAGLIKVALSLKHRAIPPHLHFTKMNPMTSSNGVLEIPLALRDWTGDTERFAGVSSFSLGGTNAHVVLGEALALDSHENEALELCLVPLSARSDQALHAYAKKLRDHLLASGDPERGVYDLAYTASLRRSHLSHRLALTGRTQRELITLLGSFIDGEPHPGLKTGRAAGKPDGLVFVFSGQGTQWAGMGQELMDGEPVFRRAVEECYELFSRFGVQASLEELANDPDGAKPEVVQPAIFAVQIGLAALLREWGVVPEAVTGHSFGEIAAAYTAGILSLEEAARLVCVRAKLFARIAGRGGMAAVELPVREVGELLSEFPGAVSLAAANSPASTVLSGETAALQTIVDALTSRNVRCRLLRVNCAFHSQQVDALTDELEAALQDLKPRTSSIPFFSTVTRTFVDGEDLKAAYWVRNARQTVWFAEAIETLGREYRVFLEVAPHAALTPDIDACLKSSDDSAKVVPTLRRDNDERTMLLRSLAALYTSGRPIQWQRLYRERGRQVRLPLYQWQRKRYWIQRNGSDTPRTQWTSHAAGTVSLSTENQAPGEYFYELQWQAKQLDDRSANLSVNVAELAQELAPWSTQAIEKFGLEHYRRIEPEVDALCSLYVVEALSALGLNLHESAFPGARFDALGVLPPFRRLLNRMIEILCEDGILVRAGDRFAVGQLPDGDAGSKWQTLIDEHPAYKVELTLLGRCGENVAKILTGHTDALELLFPGGSFAEAEHLYEASPFAQTFNSMIEQAIRLALAKLKEGETVRVLEIGAGTGGTSAYVLPLLPSGQTRYVFTDVSNLFLYKARQKFHDYAFINYKLLDIERDPQEQGFELHQFDVVIASNVLHATSDLRGALNNVSRLLAPDGLLLLLEATGKQRLVDFTFGLTNGWWEFKDNDLRPDYPLLPAKRWLNLLAECEFVTARAIPENTGDDDLQTSLILAQAPPAKKTTSDDCAGDWLILNDGSALGDELATTLRSRGGRVVERCANDFPCVPDQSPGSRVIYLSTLNETADVAGAALDACVNLLHLVQALASQPANQSLWVVTRGAQPVAEDQATLAASPLWGLGPTIAMEHAELWGGLIDLDVNGSQEEVEQIIAETLAHTGEDRAGFRGPQRYVARLRPTTHKPAFGRVRFHGDASYLITGGCGGMGLRLAQWLADRGARHLVLAGRSGAATKEAQLTVRRLEQAGVNVNVARTDVSDAGSLADLLQNIGNTMPPLRGVIHAAGIFDDRVLLRHDRERFARVMAPKVNGAWNLHLLTKETPLDFFVMFSSAAAFLGLMGLGNYTAANAFLDALAHYRQSLGLPALSIDWAGWTRIGMAEVLGERRESQWLAKGLESLTPEQGLQAVNDLMLQPRPQVAVLKIDWPVFFRELPTRRPPPLLAEVARAAGPTTTAKDSTGDFLTKLNQAERGTPRRALLREHISRQVARILEFDDSFVLDPHQPLAEVGLDSLMAIELRNLLSTSIDRQLPPTLLFDYPTIESVYSYLATLVFADESPPAIETAAAVDPELEGILAELESLPDDTVEMMFQGHARELLK